MKNKGILNGTSNVNPAAPGYQLEIVFLIGVDIIVSQLQAALNRNKMNKCNLKRSIYNSETIFFLIQYPKAIFFGNQWFSKNNLYLTFF